MASPQVLKNKRREMMATFESFEWLLRDKLISLDNLSRAMMTEMITLGARKEDIAEYVPMEFARLWKEVQQEQAERYDAKGGRSA